jgi:adenylyltransferase/sulfurtransferase
MTLPLEITAREAKAAIDSGRPMVLVDCREPGEHALTRIDGADLIPMGTVPSRLGELEARADQSTLVVYCHHGVRSLNLVRWLRDRGVANCQSMAGGIDAWSIEVDPTVARY